MRWVVVLVSLVACHRRAPRPLVHEAYVWQRAWTPAVVASVADAPTEVTALRVLMGQVDESGKTVWPAVQTNALVQSAREVVAVVRIDGSRSPQVAVKTLHERVRAWRAAGVKLRGLEIDHDCATARLAEYAAWLARLEVPEGLTLSITALPTWRRAPGLPALVKRVDEVVLQLHAVKAPTVFNASHAREWAGEFAKRGKTDRLWLALPTYRVPIHGQVVAASPVEVARAIEHIKAAPPRGLRGFVWFRLPVQGDSHAWSRKTLQSVIRAQPLLEHVTVALKSRGRDLFDVILANRGAIDAAWPQLSFQGHVASMDLLGGYDRGASGWQPPPRIIAAGEERTIGWVRGSEVTVEWH